MTPTSPPTEPAAAHLLSAAKLPAARGHVRAATGGPGAGTPGAGTKGALAPGASSSGASGSGLGASSLGVSLGLHGAVVASFLFAQSFDRTEVEGGRAQRSALITVTAAAPDASVPPPPAEPELVLDPTVDEPAADALDLDPERFDPIDWVLTEAPEKAPVDALLLEDPRLFEAAPHSPDREPRNRSFSADERAEPLPDSERAAEVADDAPAEETPPDAADRHGDVPVPDADAAVSSPPVAIDGACPPPAYPRRAVRLGWCGEVAVEITVDAGGAVVRARVLRSSGHGLLDDAALDAVRVWRFEPAEVGASAPRTMTKTFAFELP